MAQPSVAAPARRWFKKGRFRLTARGVDVLLVLGLVGLQTAISFSAPFWARLLGGPVPPSVENEGDDEQGLTPTPTPSAGAEAERQINVKLFFQAQDRDGLQLEERAVAYHADLSRQLKAVMDELIRGSSSGLVAPFEVGTRVLEVFVSSQGCAYVDLSHEAVRSKGTGSEIELMSVYAVVNTLAFNFPAVKRVQLLIDDRPVDSLAGHADLSRPLLPDLTLVAPPSPAPAETPAAEATATPVERGTP